jgi:ribose 5-phosphate isomerase B
LALKIHIASDHAGLELKSQVIDELKAMGMEVQDHGPFSPDSCDYPDFADKVCLEVCKDLHTKGILICGSGQGMVMRANKYLKIRAALCWNPEVASLARQHNDANILCLGARVIDNTAVPTILNTFFEAEFEGGRHQRRVDKIQTPPQNC